MPSSTTAPPYHLILQIDLTGAECLTGTEYRAPHAGVVYCLRPVTDDRLAVRLAPIAKRWIGESRVANDDEIYQVLAVGSEEGSGHIYLVCRSRVAADMRCWSPNEFERFALPEEA